MITHKRISLLAVLTVAIAALVAPSANAAPTRYITISSQGSVKVVPDAVRINATSTNVAPTSKEALAATAKTSAAVRAALTAAKIDKKDISTQSISVYPEYK
jgi:uncharacterized protein YggE